MKSSADSMAGMVSHFLTQLMDVVYIEVMLRLDRVFLCPHLLCLHFSPRMAREVILKYLVCKILLGEHTS